MNNPNLFYAMINNVTLDMRRKNNTSKRGFERQETRIHRMVISGASTISRSLNIRPVYPWVSKGGDITVTKFENQY